MSPVAGESLVSTALSAAALRAGAPAATLQAGAPATTLPTTLQSGVTFEDPVAAGLTLVVFALLSVFAAGTLAIAYRWYFKQSVPEGIAVITSVGIVALYINTASLGVAVSQGTVDLFRPGVVVFNVVALGTATVAAPVGRRIGDRLSTVLFSAAGLRAFEDDVGTVVRSVGRVTSVTLPRDIEDMESYDPVTAETKAELAGKTLVFPRRLTVEELRSRLSERLKEDYSVGYVDVDLTEEATVEYLALGHRVAGIGATLAPGTVAVAIRADPPNNAATGDMVQVWRDGESPARVTSGELRGVAGETVTLAVDEGDAGQLSPSESYRLLTLPAEPRADRRFATLLRGVDETMVMVTVAEGSELVGSTPRSVSATVLAIRPVEGSLLTLPNRDRPFAAGETISALGRPDVLRRLEERATTPATPPAETTGDGSDGVAAADDVAGDAGTDADNGTGNHTGNGTESDVDETTGDGNVASDTTGDVTSDTDDERAGTGGSSTRSP